METVVVRPRNSEELQLVTQVLKRMKIKAEVVQKETPAQKREREFLDKLERGARQVKDHLDGKIKLQSARQFLDEL